MPYSAIKIGARTFAIASIDDESFEMLLAQARVEINDEIKSFVDYDNQLIVVRDRLTNDHKRELIVHEVIHACLDDSGIDQGVAGEQFVAILAPRLVTILPDIETCLCEVVGVD